MVGLRYYGGGHPPASDAHSQGHGGRGTSGGNYTVDAFGLRLNRFPEAVGDQIGKFAFTSNAYDLQAVLLFWINFIMQRTGSTSHEACPEVS